MIFKNCFLIFEVYHFYAFEKHHAGFKVLSSRLKKLENLHLGGNQYNDTVFPSLTGFSSLKSLDLSGNIQLTGSGIMRSSYLNASHDILLIILFFYQQKWGLYIYLIKTIKKNYPIQITIDSQRETADFFIRKTIDCFINKENNIKPTYLIFNSCL